MKVALGTISAKHVVCYDIPDGCGVTYEPSGEPGHYDIRGNMEEMKRYLTDVKVDVERGDSR